MMSDGGFFTNERVKQGLWYDYDAQRWRLLLDNSTILYIHALVVFFIALSAKNVAFIVTRGLQLIDERSIRAVNRRLNTQIETCNDEAPLLRQSAEGTSRAHEQGSYGTLSNSTETAASGRNGKEPIRSSYVLRGSVIRDSVARNPLPLVSSGRDASWQAWTHIFGEGNPEKTWVFVCWSILMIALFLVFALGVFAPPLMTVGGMALWSSDVCGIWEFPTWDTTDEEATRKDVILRQKEARAGEYAKYCYEPWSSNQPLPVYCNFFSHSNVPFEMKKSHKCPFRNRDVCLGSDIVTFDTGLLPASYLGVNQKSPRRFRRTATCAPLNVSAPYVREVEEDGEQVFEYLYGKKTYSDEPLFNTSGNPFNWTVPTYDMAAFTTGPGIDDFWTPIDDLQTDNEEALTLFFIRPLEIYYLKSSSDPVFPADTAIRWSEDDVWYIKSDPKARVLACPDLTELCDPKGDKCWPITHHPEIIRDDRGYWLMKLALKDSTIYNSISLRLGTALVAQDMISQQNSLPLPDDHWETEARRLFATSLALAQLKVWSISSGEDQVHEDDLGWENQTPDEAEESGGLCNLLKFKSVGYTDVDLEAFLLLLILPYVVSAILGTRWQTCCKIAWSVRRRLGRRPQGLHSHIDREQGETGSRNDGEDEGRENSGSRGNHDDEADGETLGPSLDDTPVHVADSRLVFECIAQLMGTFWWRVVAGAGWVVQTIERSRG